MAEPLLVPEQEKGGGSETSHSVEFPDDLTARNAFGTFKRRLLDVNRWQEYAGSGTASFQLTDEEGNRLDRPAQKADRFCIDVPGPGSKAGNGCDWVAVDAIEQTGSDTGEMIAMRVRPVENPLNDTNDVAHFFSAEATSTFSIIREGRVITAAVHGRNEKPNLETEKLRDRVRNAVVATGAILGLNKPQWKALVTGLLEFKPDTD
ncbi:MAG TPA: hypothetical protein VF145_09755 [Chitinophagaceae bacterium]